MTPDLVALNLFTDLMVFLLGAFLGYLCGKRDERLFQASLYETPQWILDNIKERQMEFKKIMKNVKNL